MAWPTLLPRRWVWKECQCVVCSLLRDGGVLQRQKEACEALQSFARQHGVIVSCTVSKVLAQRCVLEVWYCALQLAGIKDASGHKIGKLTPFNGEMMVVEGVLQYVSRAGDMSDWSATRRTATSIRKLPTRSVSLATFCRSTTDCCILE